MFIDGKEVTALVHTGADYSVMRRQLAWRLRKVPTPWTGLQVRTAGGHLIDLAGRCTSRIGIHGFTYITSFTVLSECSRDLIIGMDFLHANGAVINLKESCVFSTKHAIASFECQEEFDALKIVDDDVTVIEQKAFGLFARNAACLFWLAEQKLALNK